MLSLLGSLDAVPILAVEPLSYLLLLKISIKMLEEIENYVTSLAKSDTRVKEEISRLIGAPGKLRGYDFYHETLGSPKRILAPMVCQISLFKYRSFSAKG